MVSLRITNQMLTIGLYDVTSIRGLIGYAGVWHD